MKHKNLKLKISCTQVLESGPARQCAPGPAQPVCWCWWRNASADSQWHSSCSLQVGHWAQGRCGPCGGQDHPRAGGSAATVTPGRRAAARRRAAATALRRASDSESESESDRRSRWRARGAGAEARRRRLSPGHAGYLSLLINIVQNSKQLWTILYNT